MTDEQEPKELDITEDCNAPKELTDEEEAALIRAGFEEVKAYVSKFLDEKLADSMKLAVQYEELNAIANKAVKIIDNQGKIIDSLMGAKAAELAEMEQRIVVLEGGTSGRTRRLGPAMCLDVPGYR